jgi:hypothetical protein
MSTFGGDEGDRWEDELMGEKYIEYLEAIFRRVDLGRPWEVISIWTELWHRMGVEDWLGIH